MVPLAFNLCFDNGKKHGLWGQHQLDLKSGSTTYWLVALGKLLKLSAAISKGLQRPPEEGAHAVIRSKPSHAYDFILR